MSLSPPLPFRSPASAATLRRLRDAAETMRRLSEPTPETAAPILPETRRLIDRLLAADSLDHLASPPDGDAARLFSYRVRPEADAPHVRFHVTDAEPGLLRFLGLAAPNFEVLQVRQAGLQFHWRSDLTRTFDEQAAILGAFCAFAPRGELMLEHLAIPVIRRHRVREIRGWIALGRDLAEDLCGPDRLSTTRRPLRSRLLRLPRRLLYPHEPAWPGAEAVTDLQARWVRRGRNRGAR